ncbi:hypothetical protein C8A06_0660 [Microbacteriaceae bacterium MWH-Ta3]|nr:hypothetical protein C8A06_0660 [Microbacteriaceae bacterium MWH-Ta3]
MNQSSSNTPASNEIQWSGIQRKIARRQKARVWAAIAVSAAVGVGSPPLYSTIMPHVACVTIDEAGGIDAADFATAQIFVSSLQTCHNFWGEQVENSSQMFTPDSVRLECDNTLGSSPLVIRFPTTSESESLCGTVSRDISRGGK